MKKFLFTLMMSALFFSTACEKTPAAEEPAGLKWLTFNEGFEKAGEKHLFIMADFYADWCSWCRVMDRETFTNPEVKAILDRYFTAVRIRTDREDDHISFRGNTYSPKQFAAGLGVQGLPTAVFFDHEGRILEAVTGFKKADEFLKILNMIVSEKKK